MINSREWGRMMEGRLYSPEKLGDPSFKKIRKAQKRFNESEYWQDKKELEKLKKHFKRAPEDMVLVPPVYFDHGNRISFGKQFYANAYLTILDENTVTFGDRVFLAPHVSIFTAGHPIDAEVRAENVEYAHPVTIGSDVWIGGNTVINPGVTIGSDVVIGSGSVVTHDIPDHVVAAGNPCRVLRPITEEERVYWKAEFRKYKGIRETALQKEGTGTAERTLEMSLKSAGIPEDISGTLKKNADRAEPSSAAGSHAEHQPRDTKQSVGEKIPVQQPDTMRAAAQQTEKVSSDPAQRKQTPAGNPSAEPEYAAALVSETAAESHVIGTASAESAMSEPAASGTTASEAAMPEPAVSETTVSETATAEKKTRKKKKPEEMTDHELLVALVKSQKSDTRFQKVAGIGSLLLVAVFAVAFAILIPQVIVTLHGANQTLQQVQTLADSAQDSLDEVDGLVSSAENSLSGVDTFVEQGNQLIADNTETITEVTQKLGEIDFDKLNQSIDDLSEVVKTLSQVTSLFR